MRSLFDQRQSNGRFVSDRNLTTSWLGLPSSKMPATRFLPSILVLFSEKTTCGTSTRSREPRMDLPDQNKTRDQPFKYLFIYLQGRVIYVRTCIRMHTTSHFWVILSVLLNLYLQYMTWEYSTRMHIYDRISEQLLCKWLDSNIFPV